MSDRLLSDVFAEGTYKKSENNCTSQSKVGMVACMIPSNNQHLEREFDPPPSALLLKVV